MRIDFFDRRAARKIASIAQRSAHCVTLVQFAYDAERSADPGTGSGTFWKCASTAEVLSSDARPSPRDASASKYGVSDGGNDADLVAVRLLRDGRTGVMFMTRDCGGTWCADDRAAAALMARAGAALPLTIDPTSASITLAGAVRAATARCTMSDCGTPALVSRIHRLARQAAAKRDGDTLRRLDRLLRFAATPPTLGGRAVIAELLEMPDREFIRKDVPDMPRREVAQATVIAAVLLRSEART